MNKWPVTVKEIYLMMPNIFCISETWMSDSGDCDSFHFDDYVKFTYCRVGRSGGGT